MAAAAASAAAVSAEDMVVAASAVVVSVEAMVAVEEVVPTFRQFPSTRRPRHTHPEAAEATAEASVADTAAAVEVRRFTASRSSRSPKEAVVAVDSEAATAEAVAAATEDTVDGNKRIFSNPFCDPATAAVVAANTARLPPSKQADQCTESTPTTVQRKNALERSSHGKAQGPCSPRSCNILLTSRARGCPRDHSWPRSP
nr:uncharacterized protein LOC119175009 [Rhipicephalus microplus]